MKLAAIWVIALLGLMGSVLANDPVPARTEQELLLKNFPMLYHLRAIKKSSKGVVFTAIRERITRDAQHAIKECRLPACFSQSLQFTDEEIKAAGDELVRQVGKEKGWRILLNLLKRDRQYQLFSKEPDTGFIRKVWQADAKGVNYVLATYIGGRSPLYPKIDAISFQNDDTAFRNSIAERIDKELGKGNRSFCVLPLQLAVDALLLNERDEAARYEPLTRSENAAAYRHTSKITWDGYLYSVILVPGLGPEQPGIKLDSNGAKRCDSAVLRWRAGLAPFLVVSGGHVHPNKTPYCEAVEMKKYMMEMLKVPESAIIIEPHARHTTTNLRNTNRLIYRFKIPFNKPVMIVTDAAQNKYINGNMKDKVVKELGYLPFEWITMLSSTESEYLPSLNSMHINPLDPLDP